MKQIVLITGASSGIGQAAAKLYANKEYFVILICDKNVESLENTRKEIEISGGQCISFVCDITEHMQVEALFAQLEEQRLIPDLVINNAGISYIGLLQDMEPSDWQHIIDVNLTGMFHVCKNLIPYYLNRGSGSILNVSSMWGNVGASCETAYSASKGGVNSFTKALAKELAPSGIPVNAVAFGTVDTRMNGFLNDVERQELAAEIPAGYFLSAEDAAEILYTVSQLHPYVTGQIITADGGFT